MPSTTHTDEYQKGTSGNFLHADELVGGLRYFVFCEKVTAHCINATFLLTLIHSKGNFELLKCNHFVLARDLHFEIFA